jgi:hypothetical protein
MPALPNSSPTHSVRTDLDPCEILSQQDGHRVYPHYPDGIEFDLCAPEDGSAAPQRHARLIHADIYERYGVDE